MTAIPASMDYNELRRQVRVAQHARSIPLLVIGALLVNYAVTDFGPSPVAWRFGAPLAFVLVWAFGKVNEQVSGVGPARGDYLIAAGAVFIAINVLYLVPRLTQGVQFNVLAGIWVGIVGIALAVLSRAGRDRVVLCAGLLVILAGIAVGTVGSFSFNGYGRTVFDPAGHNPAIDFLAIVGAVLGLTGLLLYRSERPAQ